MLNRSVLRLAVPNILSNISIPLLSAIDLGLMGHLGSQTYIGAVAIGGMIFSFLFWIFSFLRMGTSGFTAQAYGEGDAIETSHVLLRSMSVAIIVGIVLIAFQGPIAWLAFKIINGSNASEHLAKSYFLIRIYSAPAVLLMYVFIGWFIGMQNAVFPMFLTIFVNIVNIGLSVLFIKFWAWGSDGVAMAGLISQYFGVLISLVLVFRFQTGIFKQINLRVLFSVPSMIKYFNVNKDIFIRTLCLIFTLSFFTTQSANTNDTILAVNTLLFQFFYFFSYFIDGFAYAAEALTGKYIGARNSSMVRIVVKKIFAWGAITAALFSIVYLLFAEMILGLLTNNYSVKIASIPYLYWLVAIPIISFPAFIWDGVYVGATASKAMRNSMVIITFFIFLPTYYLLEPIMGNHGLWMALLIFMFSRGIFLTLWSEKHVFRTQTLTSS